MHFRSLLVALSFLLIGCDRPGEYDPWILSEDEKFSVEPWAPVYNVNDAGVADFNVDGKLDLWTTNHSSANLLLYGNGRKEGLGPDRIDQDSSAAGIEFGESQHLTQRPLSIYFERSWLRFAVSDNSPHEFTQLRVFIPWATEIKSDTGDSVKRLDCITPKPCFAANISMVPGAVVELQPVPAPSDGFPIAIELSSALSKSEVGLGWRGIPPTSHSFLLSLKDRHALAIADVLSAPGPEVFVSRGGARGRLLDVDPAGLDEFFSVTEAGFTDVIQQTGITKAGCPGRQAAWVDVDSDGDLDLYQVCGRDGVDGADFANRLYVQSDPGEFVEAANLFGLDLSGTGSFVFVPGDLQQLTLVWATEGTLEIFRRSSVGGRFDRLWRHDMIGTNDDQLEVGDLDGDGALDILRISKLGLSKISSVNTQPKISELKIPGSQIGSVQGNLVDWNADGELDVFLVPGGLFYMQNNELIPYPGLRFETRRPISKARSSWYDHDGDDDLDLWLLAEGVHTAPEKLNRIAYSLPTGLGSLFVGITERVFGRFDWNTRVWHGVLLTNNLELSGRIVSIDVQGAAPNVQAIGTTVIVEAEDGRRQVALVGATDGSRYSQTHYRLYFGVSRASKLVRLKAIFPDGEIVELRKAKAEGVVSIRHPSAR